MKVIQVVHYVLTTVQYISYPNVFTPGKDGFNDLFTPFPYKYIESIDLTIFNRWGRVVFESKNPDINWDGIEMNTGRPVFRWGVLLYVHSQ